MNYRKSSVESFRRVDEMAFCMKSSEEVLNFLANSLGFNHVYDMSAISSGDPLHNSFKTKNIDVLNTASQDIYVYHNPEWAERNYRKTRHAAILRLTRVSKDNRSIDLSVSVELDNPRLKDPAEGRKYKYLIPSAGTDVKYDGYKIFVRHPRFKNVIHYKYVVKIVEFLLDNKIKEFKQKFKY